MCASLCEYISLVIVSKHLSNLLPSFGSDNEAAMGRRYITLLTNILVILETEYISPILHYKTTKGWHNMLVRSSSAHTLTLSKSEIENCRGVPCKIIVKRFRRSINISVAITGYYSFILIVTTKRCLLQGSDNEAAMGRRYIFLLTNILVTLETEYISPILHYKTTKGGESHSGHGGQIIEPGNREGGLYNGGREGGKGKGQITEPEKGPIYLWFFHASITETSKQPIRTRYLGHVTGHQPIRDQYSLTSSSSSLSSSSLELPATCLSFHGSHRHTFKSNTPLISVSVSISVSAPVSVSVSVSVSLSLSHTHTQAPGESYLCIWIKA
eukprot:sb/3466717/